MNASVELEDSEKVMPKTREQLLNDFNFDIEDLSDEITEIEEDVTIEDAEYDFDADPEPELAYLPCACNNIQLVIKDGLKLDQKYTSLIGH